MPTRIKEFKKDPNGKGRGPGIYYHKGHGWFAKYSIERDRNKKSSGWKVDLVGLPKATRMPQVTDGFIDKTLQKYIRKKGKK